MYGMIWHGITNAFVKKLPSQLSNTRIFHSFYKVGINSSFVIKDLTIAKKKLPQVGLDLMQDIITGLGVQCLTI